MIKLRKQASQAGRRIIMVKSTVCYLQFKFLKLLLVCCSIWLILFPEIAQAASSPWTQTDWSGGSGQTSFSDATKYDSSSNVDVTTTAGQFTLSKTSNWFNTSWKYRKKITFDNSAQAENLVDFPVLVKLTSSNFDYSKAKSDGSDLRFTDSDGTTSLPYEIEKYDSTGSSFVWVKVPQIDASSSTDSIYIYYGNSAASDAQTAHTVWNSAYVMVQHLSESSGTTTTDSTNNGNNGTKVSATKPNPATGQIDGAQTFDGVSDRITVNDSASLQPGSGSWTVSIWANPANSSVTTSLISKRQSSGNFTQWSIYICGAAGCGGNGRMLAAFFVDNSGGNYRQGLSTTNVADGNWHQFTMVADKNANKIRLYSDGVELTATPNDTGSWPTITNTDPVRFGNDNGSNFYSGSEDETRVSNIARSSAWIAASYKSEADTFNTFASEEGQFSASPGTLTSSIFDSGQASDWGTLTYTATTPTNTTAVVKARSSNSSTMSGATAFASCSAITSGSDISSNNCITDGQQYIQYQVTLTSTDLGVSPTFQDNSIAFAATNSSSSSSSNSSSNSSGPPSCNDTAPPQIPQLNKITSNFNSANLFITLPEAIYDSYAVSYGFNNQANNFGANFSKPGQPGEIEQKISDLAPATTYYFKVQLRNGCNGGAWSNVLAKSTSGFSVIPSVVPAPSQPPEKITLGPGKSIPNLYYANQPISSANLPQKQSFLGQFFQDSKIAWFDFYRHLQTLRPQFNDWGTGYSNFQHDLASTFADLNTWLSPSPTQITELKATQIGRSYVVISWKTNHPSTSKVSFGSSYDYGQDVQSDERVTDHLVRIDGLKPGTTYYYEVMSQGHDYVFDARHEFQTLP